MALTYGMSVKEFWEENPDLFWAYRFSYFTNLETQQKLFNQNAWLQGAYFHEAILIALSNSFGKTKLEYPKQPYGLEQKQDDKKNQQKLLMAKIMERTQQVKTIMEGKKKTISDTNRANSSTYQNGKNTE